jgi:hypothetical protein
MGRVPPHDGGNDDGRARRVRRDRPASALPAPARPERLLGLPPGAVTGVGSLPFHSAEEAVAFVRDYCPALPFWPQLPQRHPDECAIAQSLGPLIDHIEPADRPFRWSIRPGHVEAFRRALEDDDPGLCPSSAAGFFALEEALEHGQFPEARAVKGQIEGPATLAQCLLLDGIPLIRLPDWLDRMAGFLARQAAWQVERLAAPGPPVILLVDEPVLALRDSSDLAAEAAQRALRRVLEAARDRGATAGLHCCAPIPHGSLAAVDLDVLSFDAHLPIGRDGFARQARDILDGGGLLAFGLAPTGPSIATAASLAARWLTLSHWIGGDRSVVASHTIVTATCGLGLSSVLETHASFALAREVSERIGSMARSNAWR